VGKSWLKTTGTYGKHKTSELESASALKMETAVTVKRWRTD
jgi:hypothetical protein